MLSNTKHYSVPFSETLLIEVITDTMWKAISAYATCWKKNSHLIVCKWIFKQEVTSDIALM